MSGVGAVSLGEGAIPREPVSQVIKQFDNTPMDPKLKMGVMNAIADQYDARGGRHRVDAQKIRDAAKADCFHYEGEGGTQIELGRGGRDGEHISKDPPSQEVLTKARKQGFAKFENIARLRSPNGKDRTAEETADILKDGLYGRKDADGVRDPSTAHPDKTRKIMKHQGINEQEDGTFTQNLESESAGYAALAPGDGGNAIGQSAFGFLNSGWAVPGMAIGGLATGGVGGLIVALGMGSALKKSASGMTGNGGLEGLLSGAGNVSGSGVMSNIGNISGAASYGTGATVADAMGFHGMAFNMRKIMKSYVSDFQDDSMMAMINNPNIPIEDLIFMFMAYMGDKYEKKLREKMEETVLAEKKERERERKQSEARMLGGIIGGGISLATGGMGAGVGSMIGGAIESVANRQIAIKEQLDGNMKSSTVLMQEVQMLMHKWKQINEMLSNLMKAMHDMAMTPIRNMR